MAAGVALYRALTGVAEALLATPVRLLAPSRAPLRAALTPPGAWADAARGSVWIHAASLGEVVAARRWAHTLARHGARVPFYVTTRTAAGLTRARADLAGTALATIAPFDGPRSVRASLARLGPARIDILETEIWPNWILEARAARVPVAFVSATVSERTARGLRGLGVARSGILSEGVWVLAQSRPHAERFRSLGVPAERIAVVGDVKAEPPLEGLLPPPFRRRFVVFGSLRPGEETAAVSAVTALREAQARIGFVAAPRHAAGLARTSAALGRAGFALDVRDEEARSREPLGVWLERLAERPLARVGLLATRGELPALYAEAAIAVVGGTFAPYGGHNVLEPAARGCPVIVGSHTEGILPAMEALTSEGAVQVVPDARQLGALLSVLIRDPKRLDAQGAAARRAAAAAADAAERAYAALDAFGIAGAAGAAGDAGTAGARGRGGARGAGGTGGSGGC